jgi:uncharacterized protein
MLLRSAVLLAITLYQRHLSPLKGFSCAYRIHTGCASCSVLGSRSIRRYGVWLGIGVLRQRFERCGVAHERLIRRSHFPSGQAGFCDVGCDLPCDFLAPDCAGSVCNGCSGCDLPCDCGDWGRSKKKEKEEKYVYIPPRSKRWEGGKEGAL